MIPDLILAGLALIYAVALASLAEPFWRRPQAPIVYTVEPYRPLTAEEALLVVRPAFTLRLYAALGAQPTGPDAPRLGDPPS